MLHDPHNPAWAMIRTALVTAAASLAMAITADEFDATEIKAAILLASSWGTCEFAYAVISAITLRHAWLRRTLICAGACIASALLSGAALYQIGYHAGVKDNPGHVLGRKLGDIIEADFLRRIDHGKHIVPISEGSIGDGWRVEIGGDSGTRVAGLPD